MSHKVAVVTGGSSGIGRAIALRLAQSGFDVIVHAGHRQGAAEQVVAEVESEGRRGLALLQDFKETDQLPEFVQRCWDWRGNVDCWVNNAGADVLTGALAEQDFASRLNEVLQVDVVATLLLSREIGGRMLARNARDPGRHSIINIGWDQANHGMAGDSGEMFAASKGAIMACSRSLAQSLAPGVRVNCIAPGWIQTDWGRQASAAWQERARRESLADRWGQPEDVAAVAEFLASDAANFVNGQVLCVNGGFRFAAQTHPPHSENS